jgi:hypothetical protein
VRGTIVEARDRALPALVVTVEQVDTERLARRDRLAHGRVKIVLRVAQRRLPEADVAGRHVEVARLRAEVVDLGVRIVDAGATRPEMPAVQHGETRGDVAQGQSQVHVPV